LVGSVVGAVVYCDEGEDCVGSVVGTTEDGGGDDNETYDGG
jgi:hypothetical protein